MNHTEINASAKQRILEEILESEDFHQAQKYQDLLRYLVRVSINGEPVKESTLAVKFFSKDAAFDPSMDSSVRAYISNLRKKLEHYYLTKGKNDEIKLAIPKGHYNVEFVQVRHVEKNRRPISKKLLLALLIPLVLALVILVIFLRRNTNPQKNSFNYISKMIPSGALCSPTI